MARPVKNRAFLRAGSRMSTRLLEGSVMLFQATGMLLLAFKGGAVDVQALVMAALMPAVTALCVRLYAKLWQIDRALMLLALLLCSVSLVTLKDIARASVTPRNQALFVLGGLCAMAAGIVLMRNLTHYEKYLPWAAGLTLLLLAAPLVLGEWQYGAKNWIHIPVINQSFQPSEFGKPLLILILAAGLAGQPRFFTCLPVLLFSGVLCGFLLAERDLGALLLYFLTTVGVYYAATSNALVTFTGLGMGAAGAVAAYHLFPYVQRRMETFVNPWSDPLNAGYQIVQALIAIGSGGLFGMGLGLGYPRSIPLYHSDFIFAAICEEFGLIFAILVVAVYALIAVRGAAVAANARGSFHALTATGVTILITLQAFVIIGGNIKLIPLTGVTLPFVSAGGSSMISMMGAFGLLLGVSSVNANDEAADLARLGLWEGDL